MIYRYKGDKMLEKRRLLIVDDAPENIQPLISTLKDDFAIQVAKNGEDAIKIAKQEPQPDIILLDIMMPEMDGYQVCKILKSDNLTKDIPIIFVTILDESDDEEKGLKLGAVDYITKPINPQLVRARVNNHLELKLYRDHLKHELDEKEEILMVQSRHAAMGEMIGIIAHQWRQPITTISIDAANTITSIELNDVDLEDIKNNSKSILNQTDFISKTIDDFRNFFRPNKEKKIIKLEDVVSDTKKILGATLDKNFINLTVEVKDTKTIFTYPRELIHVYINILKNAKDMFIEKDIKQGKIKVTIDSDDDYLISTICDNGGGVDEEIQDKLFDLYFSTKGEKNGLGLGLYISRIILEKHLHGSISVENNDEGACFTIRIPLSKNQA